MFNTSRYSTEHPNLMRLLRTVQEHESWPALYTRLKNIIEEADPYSSVLPYAPRYPAPGETQMEYLEAISAQRSAHNRQYGRELQERERVARTLLPRITRCIDENTRSSTPPVSPTQSGLFAQVAGEYFTPARAAQRRESRSSLSNPNTVPLNISANGE